MTKMHLMDRTPIEVPDAPTWDDIVRAAHIDAGLYHLVSLVERGMPREQALMRYALTMTQHSREMTFREVDRLMLEPAPPFIVPLPKEPR